MKWRSALAVQERMGEKEGESATEKGKELREKVIAAIRAHNNYRGKPLGVLPRWLEKLCTTEQFRAYAATLKNDNALAAYAVEQVKSFSKKQGDPWDFTKETKREQVKKKEQEKNKEKAGPWKAVRLERPEWGSVPVDGSGDIECPVILHESEIKPGARGIGPMSWETFGEKSRMLLELQGGPLAAVLPGTLEEAKKKKQYLFKGEFEGKFQPTELYCPATDPERGRRILEPALLVQLGRMEIHLLQQKPEIKLRIDRRLEMIAILDKNEFKDYKDVTRVELAGFI